tara:strand:+ start:3869 stop:4132 length:264 start_codon:yes stop_codon:yes gene_type:complete
MSIQVNMTKARDIWRDKWRVARKPLLEELDVEFMRATESADQAKQTEVAAKKQELRDATDTDINNIDNPDHLKLIWPQCLGDKPENL